MGRVLQLLKERLSISDNPGGRRDRAHLALVLEGGGMRGVVAGGMVTGLEELGALRCFDSVHGSSAGACAGAYFVAGQARLGTSIYFEDINNFRFINFGRPLVGRPIMQTSYLVDNVMRYVKPLSASKIVCKRGFLNIVCTDVSTCKPHTIRDFESEDEVFSALRATITMPVIAGRSVMINGRHLFDGGMTQQIAIESAVESGATHILVMLTRRAGELERERKVRNKRSPDLFYLSRIYSQEVSELYLSRNDRINSELAVVNEGVARNGALIESLVRPHEGVKVERLTLNGRILREAADEARTVVRRALEQ